MMDTTQKHAGDDVLFSDKMFSATPYSVMSCRLPMEVNA